MPTSTADNIHAQQSPEALSPEELERKYGIRNPTQLASYNSTLPAQSYLIQDLIADQGITISIGASHVGKSPFWGQACIAVAAGLSNFVGRACYSSENTRVLYLDCENRTRSVQERLEVMSRHLGLYEPPATLFTWNLNATRDAEEGGFGPNGWKAWLEQRIADVRPKLVVIDPITAICPKFGEDRQQTYGVVTELRQLMDKYQFALVIIHHIRKGSDSNPRLRLDDAEDAMDLSAWLDQGIGSGSIINSTDIRLGMDHCTSGRGDVIVRGYEREQDEQFPPLYVKRAYATDGENDGKPVAYEAPTALDQLTPQERAVWENLPPGEFKWMKIDETYPGNAVGTKKKFADTCISLGVLRRVRFGVYAKIDPIQPTSPAQATPAVPASCPTCGKGCPKCAARPRLVMQQIPHGMWQRLAKGWVSLWRGTDEDSPDMLMEVTPRGAGTPEAG